MGKYRRWLQPATHLGREYRRKTFSSVLTVRSHEMVIEVHSNQRTSLETPALETRAWALLGLVSWLAI